jgi:hypothetical protein
LSISIQKLIRRYLKFLVCVFLSFQKFLGISTIHQRNKFRYGNPSHYRAQLWREAANDLQQRIEVPANYLGDSCLSLGVDRQAHRLGQMMCR